VAPLGAKRAVASVFTGRSSRQQLPAAQVSPSQDSPAIVPRHVPSRSSEPHRTDVPNGRGDRGRSTCGSSSPLVAPPPPLKKINLPPGAVKQQPRTAQQPPPPTNPHVHQSTLRVPYAAAPNQPAVAGATGNGQAAPAKPPNTTGGSGTSGGGQGGRTWPRIEGFNAE
jgi:hypothetical protein